MSPPIERILFFAASSLPDKEQRDMLLDRACKDDPLLRGRLDRLFATRDEAADFFEPARPPIDAAKASGANEESGGWIGRYRLIGRIGAGGCGVVYLAEQREPVQRKVALKIIRVGMDTENVITRFEQERQALALMDHPNIARVLDAGATASGRPYFVMELVDGEKITDFCDGQKLNIRQRLELFIQICRAVQHAHLKGVIHRDIKPSNILVRIQDGTAIPKVIDFGIAKAAGTTGQDDVTLTAVDQIIGTPAYMSPEIAAGGKDVDTRTDIHSLGGVIYELLVGKSLFDPERLKALGMDQIRRILREEDPMPPSSRLASMSVRNLKETAESRNIDPPKLISSVRGGLDWIVMKAVDRDRDRRYDTANGLAMDVERYLRNEAVSASPPDWTYRTLKFLQRYKIYVLFGATVLFLLIAGFSTSTILFLREKNARNEQERLKSQADLARESESELKERARYRLLISQAAVEIGRNNLKGADRLIAQIPERLAPPSLETAEVFSRIGEWQMDAGNWQEAANCFTSSIYALTGLERSNTDAVSTAFLPAGATLSLIGDKKRFRKIRLIAVERFARNQHMVMAERIVKFASLMPLDSETRLGLQPLVVWLQAATDRNAETKRYPDQQRSNVLALTLWKYRRGNYKAASEQLLKYDAAGEDYAPRREIFHTLQGMIAWRQGRNEEARALIQSAVLPIGNAFSRNFKSPDPAVVEMWYDWVNAQSLNKEALSLIGK